MKIRINQNEQGIKGDNNKKEDHKESKNKNGFEVRRIRKG